MTTNVTQTITLTDLANEFEINKSKLHYYVSSGLIKPVQTIGKTMVFHSRIVRKQLRLIEREQIKGKKLSDIKSKILKMK